MAKIGITVDHRIRTKLSALPDDVRAAIFQALTIPNVAKEEARRANQWDWQSMPDYVALYKVFHDELVMPRGFLESFLEGCRVFGRKVEIDDQRTWQQIFRAGSKLQPREYQLPAIDAFIKHEQGIYKAPAGSGKTFTVLATIRRLACKSLVIVNTKDILWQWQHRVAEFLGPHYPVGQVGDKIFDVSPYVTVATAQTLHRRFDALVEQGFFDEFSFVCLDECHHATAETYNRVLDRFSARYRVGVSATPDKTGDFALALNVLGPIIHVTKPEDVPHLMKPEVIKVPTKFGFGFRSAQSRWQRSNYPQLIDALISNPARNRLIAAAVMENQGHHQLLVSKRLDHLNAIHELLESAGFSDPIVTITGKDDNAHRKEAKALAEVEPCLILSTLADEALDIPRLDRLYLVYPQRNPGLITQQVGRVEREHPDKPDAVIYDFCDLNVPPLEKQWRIRLVEVYKTRGYTVTTRKAEEFEAPKREEQVA